MPQVRIAMPRAMTAAATQSRVITTSMPPLLEQAPSNFTPHFAILSLYARFSRHALSAHYEPPRQAMPHGRWLMSLLLVADARLGYGNTGPRPAVPEAIYAR